MNIGNAFPSKYLKAANITQPVRVTIERVDMEDVSGRGKKEMKPVLYFVAKEKGMVLNKTNSGVIEAVYGTETDEWVGKRVEIYAGETTFAGDMVPCLRLRIPKDSVGGNSAGARPAPTRMPVRQPEPSPVSEEQQFEEADVPF